MPSRKVPPLSLEADRDDAIPTDPSTHTPSVYLPARYINEPILALKDLQEQFNLLWDEVEALRSSGGGGVGGGGGDGGGGGGVTAWPTMLHRWICWKRPAGSQFIPDEATATGPRLTLYGGAGMSDDGNGVLIRASGVSGPQYAMAETPGLDLRGPFSVVVLVRDYMSNVDGGAYTAVGNSQQGRNYLTLYKEQTNLAALIRTHADERLLSTLDAPNPAPLTIGGTGWKLMDLTKSPRGFFATDITKIALGQDPNGAGKLLDSTILDKFVASNVNGGVNRVGFGIIPRMLEVGELKGLAHYTLGAAFVFTSNISTDTRMTLYRTVRSAQQAAGLSTVLPAPTI